MMVLIEVIVYALRFARFKNRNVRTAPEDLLIIIHVRVKHGAADLAVVNRFFLLFSIFTTLFTTLLPVPPNPISNDCAIVNPSYIVSCILVIYFNPAYK